MKTTTKRPYTSPAMRVVVLAQRPSLLVGSTTGSRSVVINLSTDEIIPDVGGSDWSWDDIDPTSPDR